LNETKKEKNEEERKKNKKNWGKRTAFTPSLYYWNTATKTSTAALSTYHAQHI